MNSPRKGFEFSDKRFAYHRKPVRFLPLLWMLLAGVALAAAGIIYLKFF